MGRFRWRSKCVVGVWNAFDELTQRGLYYVRLLIVVRSFIAFSRSGTGSNYFLWSLLPLIADLVFKLHEGERMAFE